MPLNSVKSFFERNLQGKTSYIALYFPLPPFACYCNLDPIYAMRGSLCLYEDELARRCDQEVQSTPAVTQCGLRLVGWLTNKNSTAAYH